MSDWMVLEVNDVDRGPTGEFYVYRHTPIPQFDILESGNRRVYTSRESAQEAVDRLNGAKA